MFGLTPQELALKALGAIVAAAACAAVGATFAYRYERAQFVAFQQQVIADGIHAADIAKATKEKDDAARKAVDDEANKQLADYGSYVGQLLVQLHQRTSGSQVRPAASSAGHIDVLPVGPGFGQPDPAVGASVPGQSCPDDTALGNVAKDSLRALKLWREYARQTGQVQP